MKAHVAGTGRYVPSNIYDNAFMASFVDHPSWKERPERLYAHLGIKTRHFLSELSLETGKPVESVDELTMAADAARKALEAASMESSAIDLLIFVSCTAQSQPGHRNRLHFARSAGLLHGMLNLRSDASFLELDAGCAGALCALERGHEAILSGRRKHVLIVASSAPSQYMDRDFYKKEDAVLAPLIFGDGAGAVVLSASMNGKGIVESVSFCDPNVPLMDMRGGMQDPTLAYWIDGAGVKKSFGPKATHALEALSQKVPQTMQSDAFFFHQANGRVLDVFIEKVGIDPLKAPKNIDRYGNTAAAATFILLDEEVQAQRVGSRSRITFCVVGAGAVWGAMHIIL
jgi:3-oxoacyl-[acyl-carrier-protein] synthase-3